VKFTPLLPPREELASPLPPVYLSGIHVGT